MALQRAHGLAAEPSGIHLENMRRGNMHLRPEVQTLLHQAVLECRDHLLNIIFREMTSEPCAASAAHACHYCQ